jgi:pimeloyl-ACP methyl ester carboxylesterase
MHKDWTEHDIVVDGVRLHTYRLGDGDKPPLVLVHGFSDNGLCWLATARDLRARYDVVMPDARAHGLSARVQPGKGIDMTADLAGIIRGLGLKRPIVAGHSMGALIAAQLGARYPDLPRALILEDPPWFPPDPAAGEGTEVMSELGQESPQAAWIRSLEGLSLEALMAQFRAEHPSWSDTVLRWWCRGKQQLDMGFFGVRDRGMGDWQETVRAIACPTLMVTADPEKGGLIRPEVAEMVVGMNDRFSVAHIPGTGHHVRFEDDKAYMAAFVAFLDEVEG